MKNCKVGKVYVTSFPDMSEFKKHSNNIAWETEVWLMEVPDHLIHFNGDRFMGPRLSIAVILGSHFFDHTFSIKIIFKFSSGSWSFLFFLLKPIKKFHQK